MRASTWDWRSATFLVPVNEAIRDLAQLLGTELEEVADERGRPLDRRCMVGTAHRDRQDLVAHLGDRHRRQERLRRLLETEIGEDPAATARVWSRSRSVVMADSPGSG